MLAAALRMSSVSEEVPVVTSGSRADDEVICIDSPMTSARADGTSTAPRAAQAPETERVPHQAARSNDLQPMPPEPGN
jgi:hypothetical protein